MPTYRPNPPQQIGLERREPARGSLPAELASEIHNPIRRMGLFFALIFIFLRFSQMHELLTYTLGFNTYILYFFGPPAIVLAVLAGGLRRVFSSKIAWLWAGFVLWMLLSTPFSFWRANSIVLVLKYMRTELPCLLLIAGLCITWHDIRKFLMAIGAAAVWNILIARFFLDESAERLYLEFGSIANANDFAAHLILVMPFLLLGILWPRQKLIVRLMLGVLIGYGLYMVLGTGSRGAMVALLAVCCFSFVHGTNTLRVVAIVFTPLAAFVLFSFLPATPKERLSSLFIAQSTGEAAESRMKRSYLLTQSLRLTAQHPIFGVGVGQFMNYEGDEAIRQGVRGAWQVSHNSYTQVSSELGLPGLFLFLSAVIATYLGAARLQKQARQRPEWKPIETTAFCLILSLLGFGVAIFFLSLAYGLYLPTLSALVIAITSIVRQEIALTAPTISMLPPWANRTMIGKPRNRLAQIAPTGRPRP